MSADDDSRPVGGSQQYEFRRTLVFGEIADHTIVSVTSRDLRCAMVNLDPETAEVDPAIMKAAVRPNQNNAGVYGTVVKTGSLSVDKNNY